MYLTNTTKSMIFWQKKHWSELIFFGLNTFLDVIEIPKLQNHVGRMESLNSQNYRTSMSLGLPWSFWYATYAWQNNKFIFYGYQNANRTKKLLCLWGGEVYKYCFLNNVIFTFTLGVQSWQYFYLLALRGLHLILLHQERQGHPENIQLPNRLITHEKIMGFKN